MRKSLLLVLGLAGIAWADTGYKGTIQVAETDGSPKCVVGQIKVTTGTLTCSGQVATIAIGGGGGGATTPKFAVNSSTAAFLTTTNSALTDTGFGVTISPSSVTSLIRIDFPNVDTYVTGNCFGIFSIFRGIGGTDLGAAGTSALAGMNLVSATGRSVPVAVVDIPATVSPVTYELYAHCSGTQLRINDENVKMYAIAQEIH